MNKQFNETAHNLKDKTLSEIIEAIDVLEEWNNQTSGLDGWFAVASDLGIIAYFGERKEAERFRIEYINRILSVVWNSPLHLVVED